MPSTFAEVSCNHVSNNISCFPDRQQPWKSEISIFFQYDSMMLKSTLSSGTIILEFSCSHPKDHCLLCNGDETWIWRSISYWKETSFRFWSGSVRLQDQCLWLFCPDVCGAKGAGRPSAECDFLHLGLALFGRGAVFRLRASVRPTLVSGCYVFRSKNLAREAHGPCGPANSAETGVSRSVCPPSLHTLSSILPSEGVHWRWYTIWRLAQVSPQPGRGSQIDLVRVDSCLPVELLV